MLLEAVYEVILKSSPKAAHAFNRELLPKLNNYYHNLSSRTRLILALASEFDQNDIEHTLRDLISEDFSDSEVLAHLISKDVIDELIDNVLLG